MAEPINNPELLQAAQLFRGGNRREARSVLVNLLEQEPKNTQAWYLLGLVLEDRQQQAYAFRQVLRLDPYNPYARRRLAELSQSASVAAQPTDIAQPAAPIDPAQPAPMAPPSARRPIQLSGAQRPLTSQPKTSAKVTPGGKSLGKRKDSLKPGRIWVANWQTRTWKLRKNVTFWLGMLIVGLFFLAALAAPLLAPPDPGVEFSTYKGIGQINRLVPFPPKAGLLLGSVPDPANLRQLDIWYSLVWGVRSALRFGVLVVFFAGSFGVILGGVSAYLGGMPNTLMMGFTDAFLALPIIAGVIFFRQFVLMLLLGSGAMIYLGGMVDFLKPPTAWQIFLVDVDPLLIAFIVFSWMPYARLMNSVVLHARQEEYLLAARSLGAGHLRLIFRHLIPNSISPAIILAARDVGYLVLLQAGFTFIGLSHRSEWGELLSLGRNYVIGPGGNPFTYWWLFFPPTLAVVLFGVGWNLLGDGLNDWLNPHQS